MRKQETPDPVDALLTEAFEKALSGPGNAQLIDQLMTGIRRQQRLRSLVLTLFSLLAVAVCLLSGMPLLESLSSLFSGWFAGVPTENPLSLPATMLAVVIAIAGAWLLIEETTG